MTSQHIPVGLDSSKLTGAHEGGPHWTLDRAAAFGLDGVFFRSAFELSRTLDPVEMRDVADHARDCGLYLEAGIATINPFASPESPEIRVLGDGDYAAGLMRMIDACAAIDIRELWTYTANYQFRIAGLYACDRFRTDVKWQNQLDATRKFVGTISPALRDLGVHLNVETHEEITSFELVRLVEHCGPDVLGVTFDTANVLVRGEDPHAAATRLAPYVRATQIRDAGLFHTPEGIARFLLPCGDGVMRWEHILATLIERAPRLTLSIEGVTRTNGELPLYIYNPVWLAAHPDMTVEELSKIVRMANEYEARVASGDALGAEALRNPVSDARSDEFILNSAEHLRKCLGRIGALGEVVSNLQARTAPTEKNVE
ncbi:MULTISPECIES: sugar phosphate isomerase/epimerase family protein [unclassified Streptomyces]|uniref:sugar phosphate isomerase/epimerase family protein n=1 Tax=unclassified Streptomyces TaxID=2593676 RepID=UPI0035DE146A